MSEDQTITIEYCYLRLYTWTERDGDQWKLMGRADKYNTFTHELIERGEPHCNGVMYWD